MTLLLVVKIKPSVSHDFSGPHNCQRDNFVFFYATASNAGNPGSIPGLGRCPGERIGYLLQYSWAPLMAQMVKNLPTVQVTSGLIPGVEKFSEAGHSTHSIILAFRICMDRGAWQATVHGITKSWTRLSD